MNVFENQTAVVTGAGGTLCAPIALDLARLGARVALLGRSREKLEKTERAIREAGGVCRVYPCDVTDEKALLEVGESIEKEWGPCRYLVNGAGGNQNRAVTTLYHYDPCELSNEKPEGTVGFFDLDAKALESVLLTNTMGTLLPTRVFARQMARNGGGAVLNFASMNSYRPLTRVPAYAMSKAAVVNLTQWIATYFAPAGIRVNAVAPGFFINERSVRILGSPQTGLTARGESVLAHTPQKGFGQPEDLLGCVEWLLDGEKARFVTGITVPVDGGFLAHSGV